MHHNPLFNGGVVEKLKRSKASGFCFNPMANPPRNRKRVRALRRAPDGSAFQKWYFRAFFTLVVPFPVFLLGVCENATMKYSMILGGFR